MFPQTIVSSLGSILFSDKCRLTRFTNNTALPTGRRFLSFEPLRFLEIVNTEENNNTAIVNPLDSANMNNTNNTAINTTARNLSSSNLNGHMLHVVTGNTPIPGFVITDNSSDSTFSNSSTPNNMGTITIPVEHLSNENINLNSSLPIVNSPVLPPFTGMMTGERPGNITFECYQWH